MRRTNKQEARRKRNNMIIGFSMIFLMIFSIIAFSIDSSNQEIGSFEYNNFSFNEKIVFDDQVFFQDIRKYYTVVNGEDVEFFFTPGLMSQVNVSEDNLSFLNNTRVVSFTRKPIDDNEFNVNLLFYDILILEYYENSFKTVRKGITEHNLFDSDLDIINCDDASFDNLVFVLSNNRTDLSIHEIEPFCFEVSGNGEDLFIISDYLLYKTHGVI